MGGGGCHHSCCNVQFPVPSVPCASAVAGCLNHTSSPASHTAVASVATYCPPIVALTQQGKSKGLDVKTMHGVVWAMYIRPTTNNPADGSVARLVSTRTMHSTHDDMLEMHGILSARHYCSAMGHCKVSRACKPNSMESLQAVWLVSMNALLMPFATLQRCSTQKAGWNGTGVQQGQLASHNLHQ